MRHLRGVLGALLVAIMATACAGGGGGFTGQPAPPPPLVIGGIPDQDVAVLERRFGGVAAYLSRELGLPVEYQPATDYSAVVTAFSNGDVQLGWFGGLTGVQARLETPDARAAAQRPVDAEFHSVFIVGPGVEAASLDDLRGKSFTFGSESSTSGHLMPRFFMTEAGINPETDLAGPPSYSGSHDKTYALVQAGSFQAGVLNESVWEDAVEQGKVDPRRVRVLNRTPPYADYHWLINPVVDQTYGPGTADRIQQALLAMGTRGPEAQQVLSQFETEAFIPTRPENYSEIETVARQLGLIAQ